MLAGPTGILSSGAKAALRSRSGLRGVALAAIATIMPLPSAPLGADRDALISNPDCLTPAADETNRSCPVEKPEAMTNRTRGSLPKHSLSGRRVVAFVRTGHSIFQVKRVIMPTPRVRADGGIVSRSAVRESGTRGPRRSEEQAVSPRGITEKHVTLPEARSVLTSPGAGALAVEGRRL